MKPNSIIHRYIMSEMMPPFFITMVFFTFVFLMTKMLEITNWIVNYNISLVTVVLFIVYATPFFMVFVIPMSIMLSVLLTFLRLSGDNELIALKSGGVSIYQLLWPVGVFAVVGYGLTLFMNIYAMPWGFQSTYDLLYQVATRNIDIGLKERTFNDQFEDVVLYVNKVDVKDRRLIDVFIEDKRAGDAVSTILAPEGRLFSEPEKLVYHLRLYNGNISTVSLKDKSAHTIRFDTYDIRLDLKRLAGNIRRKSKDVSALNFDTIRNHLGESSEKDTFYYKVLIEYHKKFSIPFSCIALALLAVPLGVQSKTAKKSFGIILGLFFFLLYYMMITAGVILGETGALHPLIGMWVPNIVIAIVGLVLLIRTANERTVGLDLPFDLWRKITARFRAPRDQLDNQEESKI